MYPGLGCPLIGNDFHIEIQVVNTEACVCQEEGECDHYLLVIWALQPWIKQSTIHQHASPPRRRLFSKPCAPPHCQHWVFSFIPRPPIYHIFISHWCERSLYSKGCCRYTRKQSQITWGCFPTFFIWHFLGWSDLHLPEVLFHAWLYCFTLCVKRRE